MTDNDKALVEELRNEDSYYRVQEKHWCIDAEELERQRLTAADRIEAQAARLAEADALIELQNQDIGRLKAEVKNAWCDDTLPCRQLLDAKQEIERLREALRNILDLQLSCAKVIARTALGETE